MKPYFQDDQSTIYHGDVFDVIEAAGEFHTLLTDPPYSSGGAFRSDRNKLPSQKYTWQSTRRAYVDFSGDNRDQRSYLAWCMLWGIAAASNMPKGGNACIFTDWRQLGTITDSVQSAGFVFRGIGTWHKTGSGRPMRGSFFSGSEFVVHGTLGPVTVECYVPSVVSHLPTASKIHMTEKPEAVMAWLIPFCPEGETILDPFMGSGSSLVAARCAGRKAIGGDVDEQWCEVAAKRLESTLDFGVSAK